MGGGKEVRRGEEGVESDADRSRGEARRRGEEERWGGEVRRRGEEESAAFTSSSSNPLPHHALPPHHSTLPPSHPSSHLEDSSSSSGSSLVLPAPHSGPFMEGPECETPNFRGRGVPPNDRGVGAAAPAASAAASTAAGAATSSYTFSTLLLLKIQYIFTCLC
ncbi:hypothetical protein CLOM_g18756 [Closterium sp. NIES-68]|nr:hypothetical protein CLOM_g18756 [Closterium sp. NIES-68]